MDQELNESRFQVLTVQEALPLYRRLWSEVRSGFNAFPGFDFFHQQLFAGKFSLLRERYHSEVFALLREGQAVALATHLAAKDTGWGEPHALGMVLVREDASEAELDQFHTSIGKALGSAVVQLAAPINGHMALGLSLPESAVSGDKISFLTAASTPATQRFFENPRRFRKIKTYHALSVFHTPDLESKLRQEVSAKPKGISTRPISFIRFKRDIAIYSALVNECMKEHPRFHPLSAREDWELMRMSLTLIHRGYFRFLMKDGREIGFCFGMPDYNPHLKAGDSDALNTLRLLFVKKRVKKGRIIYSGILPEHRGAKIFRYVRHEVMLAMFQEGIREIESSYVDETNQASLGNVRSTGATIDHSFSLYGWAVP